MFSLITLFLLRKVAKHPLVGLVDKPNERKLHEGTVPLVGGISICLSILYFLYNNPELISHTFLYSFCIIVLVVVGALDDKYDISFKFRMAVQAILALLMLHMADAQLANLGNIFGFGSILLPDLLGKIITVFAVLGAINAFNMVDGIDGLLGGLASVTFGGLGILFFMRSMPNYAHFCAVLIVVMIPYILFNLNFLGRRRKVFMGDAGSMVIGFTVIFLLISATQPTSDQEILNPVTALWLIAVPLMDMAAIMYRRIRRGDSPFRPDREHLHHIFQRIGFNSKQTLFAICSLSITCAAIGIFGEIYHVPDSIMFYLFVILFIIYSFVLSNIWKVKKFIRSLGCFITRT
jgi:UDP-GlcNAc:undecaprenyl-phosphate GlcNAc-1-phosphate transferase